jgi:glycosyltransferase involved in cell wall biosynthesis
MKALRLLHIIPSYWPALRYGGPIRSVHGLAKALVAQGHRVRVLTTDIDGSGRLDVPTDRWVELDGVEVRYCPVGVPRRITRAPAMAVVLSECLDEVDLVHLHGGYQWSTWLGSRACRNVARPYILSPRGLFVRELIRQKSALAKRLWLALVDRRVLGGAGAIHLTSEVEAAELRALGLDLAPLAIVPNGLDVPESLADPTEVEAAWAGIPRGRRLLHLGRINWKKGLDRLLHAMPLLPQAVLVAAGNDEEGLRPRLEALARELGLADRVRFPGPVEGAGKWALLAGADLFVVPSLNENWGIAATEALAAGTPVVTTEGVGAAAFVREHGLGTVTDGTPEALARAIAAWLARPPEERAAVGDRARRTVAEELSWRTVVQRMHGVYERAIARVQSLDGARAPVPVEALRRPL